MPQPYHPPIFGSPLGVVQVHLETRVLGATWANLQTSQGPEQGGQ